MPSMAVLVETWRWRLKRESSAFEGAYVLFMDGHVEWMPLGTFPVVPSVMEGLCGMVQQSHGIMRDPLDE